MSMGEWMKCDVGGLMVDVCAWVEGWVCVCG